MINIQMILNLKENDGLTLKAGNVIRYKSGWQVADYGVEVTTAEECLQAIENFEGNCGVWLENGIYYVDHSFRIDTKKEALKIGRKYSQISIYGWKTEKLAYC